MLNEGDSAPMGVSEKRAERCKPDYETMIANLQKRIDRTQMFKDAALGYFEGKRARNKMAELIGELITEYNMLVREHGSLLKAQEADQE